MGDKYAFARMQAQNSYLALVRKYRARLDTKIASCEAGYQESAYVQINVLLSRTGASPHIAAHDGRGPQLHVSRPQLPLLAALTAASGSALPC